MAADLFETYAVTAVAVMLLGTESRPRRRDKLYLYPLALGGVSAIASVIGTFFARLGRGDERASSTRSTSPCSPRRSSRRSASSRSRWRSTAARTASRISTSRRSSASSSRSCSSRSPSTTPAPAGTRSRRSRRPRRPATRRTSSRASPSACRRRPLPVIVIVAGILTANHFAGLYGIGVAVMAQLSMTGLIVALDAFGPVTDNAGGIAEMADLPESVRGDHRPARRGRQHDQGRHEGLRDRLGRARGARPVRLLHDRAHRRRHGRTRSSDWLHFASPTRG